MEEFAEKMANRFNFQNLCIKLTINRIRKQGLVWHVSPWQSMNKDLGLIPRTKRRRRRDEEEEKKKTNDRVFKKLNIHGKGVTIFIYTQNS
jgi:hypothetical protein